MLLWISVILLLGVASADFNLTILHTGQLFGNFVPVTSGLYPCDLSQVDTQDCTGGMWNKAREIAARRAVDPNVILVDNGDNIWGSLFTQTDHGELFWDVFDAMNYSAFVFGPRDADYSQQLPLSPKIKSSNFPTVISNSIISNTSGLNGTVYSVTIDVGGEQIGIIGITGESSPRITSSWPSGAEIYSPVTACQRYVDAFTNAGVNKIIVVYAHPDDQAEFDEVAISCPGVDVIVQSGYGLPIMRKTPASGEVAYPGFTQSVDPNRLIPQVYVPTGGQYLGRLVVQFDDNGKVISILDGDIILLSNPVTPPVNDPPVVQEVRDMVINAYNSNYQPLNASLGINRQVLNNTRELVRYFEAPVGNLVTDAMCWAAKQNYPQISACMNNGGSFRDYQAAGSITAEDLYRIIPFAGYYSVVTLPATSFLQVMQLSVSQSNTTRANSFISGRYLQVSGIKMSYNPAPQLEETVVRIIPGNDEAIADRIINLDVYDPTSRTYKPFDLTKSYTVAVPDYVLNGGDNYAPFLYNSTVVVFRSFGLVVQSTADYIANFTPVDPAVTDRLTPLANVPPKDFFYVAPLYNSYDSPTGIGFTFAASFGLVSTLIILLITIVYWNTPIFRSASPSFLVVMIFAIILGFTTLYFWIGLPNTGLCVVRIVFPTLGFALFFGAILAKTGRMFFLFRAFKKMKKPTPIKDWELLIVVAIAGAIQAIITTCWMAIATPRPVIIVRSSVAYLICDADNPDLTPIFYGLTLGYCGLLLICSAVLAYATRKLPSWFNESSYIALSIYTILLLSIIILILALTLDDFPTTVHLFLMLGFAISSFSSLYILFLPKCFIALFRAEKNTKEYFESSVGIANHGGGARTNSAGGITVGTKSPNSN